MARERKIVEQEIKSVEKKNRGFWRYLWFPTALFLALAAGGLTGVLGSYYLNNSRYSVEVSALATFSSSITAFGKATRFSSAEFGSSSTVRRPKCWRKYSVVS